MCYTGIMIYRFDHIWSYLTNEPQEVINAAKKILTRNDYDFENKTWKESRFWYTHSNILGFETIKFPSGLCDYLSKELNLEVEHKRALQKIYKKEDVMEVARRVKTILPSFEIRDYQIDLVLASVTKYASLIVSATASGKTSTMTLLSLIWKRKKTLVMNNQNFILKQIYDRFISMGIKEEEISMSTDDLSKRILIVSSQTSYNRIKQRDPDYLKFLEDVEVIICDECAHFQSASHFSILFFTPKLEHLVGYTATPYKNPKNPYKNTDDMALIGLLGEPAIEFTLQNSIEGNNIAQPYSYFINYKAYPIEYPTDTPFFVQYRRSIVYNKVRNKAGIEMVKYLDKKGIKTLVLFREVKNHGLKVMAELSKCGVKCMFLQGGEKIHEYDQNLKIHSRKGNTDDIKAALNSDYNIILASQVMDEGVDISLFQAGVLFTGGQSAIKIIQQTGRVSRKKEGKENIALVVDFNDSEVNNVMNRHYKTRKKTLQNNGVIELENVHKFFDIVDKMAQ